MLHRGRIYSISAFEFFLFAVVTAAAGYAANRNAAKRFTRSGGEDRETP